LREASTISWRLPAALIGSCYRRFRRDTVSTNKLRLPGPPTDAAIENGRTEFIMSEGE